MAKKKCLQKCFLTFAVSNVGRLCSADIHFWYGAGMEPLRTLFGIYSVERRRNAVGNPKGVGTKKEGIAGVSSFWLSMLLACRSEVPHSAVLEELQQVVGNGGVHASCVAFGSEYLAVVARAVFLDHLFVEGVVVADAPKIGEPFAGR